jgi:hypothetical protein
MQASASPQGSRGVHLSINGTAGTGGPGSGGGMLHGGLKLLGQLTVDVADPAVPYDIRMVVVARDGWLACDSVTVASRGDGPPVTGAAMRVPKLAAYLSQARDELGGQLGAGLIVHVNRVTEHATSYGFASPADWDRLDFAQRRRAAQLTPELVAACYREALADPEQSRRPTAAVAERLHASRGHISRVLTAARRQGLTVDQPPDADA